MICKKSIKYLKYIIIKFKEQDKSLFELYFLFINVILFCINRNTLIINNLISH